MLTKRKLTASVKMVLLIFFAISCDEPMTELISTSKTLSLKSTPALEFIRSLGYHDSTIVEHDEYYVVEKDIRFSKAGDYSKSSLTGRIAQISPSAVSMSEIVKVKVGIWGMATSGPDNWRPEILAAISGWINLPNNAINVELVDCQASDCTNANVRITLSSNSALSGDGELTEGFYPIAGKPGTAININLSWKGNITISSSVKQRAFAHALGHVLGLGHTDSNPQYNTIPGTPCTDPSSVMNLAGAATKPWNGFSQYEIIAVQYLYPTLIHQAGTVPFYRYRANYGIGDHFYTWNWNEIGCGQAAAYTPEGIACYIYPSQLAGSVPIYRYVGPGNDHFYTLVQQNYPDYSYESIAGYAYTYNAPGTIPIYRYVGPGNEHFYTKVYYNYPGYSYEMIAFYAYP
jgi:hypothetical protein